MDVKEFVGCWRREKDDMVEEYCDRTGTYVRSQIALLNLSDDQSVIMRRIVNSILTDAFYTLLLGLDGAASIGGVQEPYTIHDDSGNLIFESGDLEGEAWEQFHRDNPESGVLVRAIN